MTVLHTSDWHLGARLCDRDRSDEHKAFFSWLLETLNREKVDCLLVSGDIFDSSNPPNSAEAMYYDFLCALGDSYCKHVIITGGNHDSVSKLNSSRELLKRLSITVVGGAPDESINCICPLADDKGELQAVVCAVPFLRERDIRVPVPGESWDERERSVAQGIGSYYEEVLKAAENLTENKSVPVISMGHLFVTGSLSGEGQRDLYVGNLGSINADIFSDRFSYTALGHLHRSQIVGGRGSVRYCGSPLALEFGETGEKSVLLAQFSGNELSEVRALQIPRYRDLIRFSGSFDEICEQIDNFKAPENTFWADAEVYGFTKAGDVSLLLNEKASLREFEFLRIKVHRNEEENIFESDKLQDIKDLDAEEVFRERCLSGGLEQSEIDELLPMYRELIIKVEEQEKQHIEN